MSQRLIVLNDVEVIKGSPDIEIPTSHSEDVVLGHIGCSRRQVGGNARCGKILGCSFHEPRLDGISRQTWFLLEHKASAFLIRKCHFVTALLAQRAQSGLQPNPTSL